MVVEGEQDCIFSQPRKKKTEPSLMQFGCGVPCFDWANQIFSCCSCIEDDLLIKDDVKIHFVSMSPLKLGKIVGNEA